MADMFPSLEACTLHKMAKPTAEGLIELTVPCVATNGCCVGLNETQNGRFGQQEKNNRILIGARKGSFSFAALCEMAKKNWFQNVATTAVSACLSTVRPAQLLG